MKPLCVTIGLVLIATMIGLPALGQENILKGRSALELNFGFWGGAKISNTVATNGVKSEAETGGLHGSLLYINWMREQVAITFGMGVLGGKASVAATSLAVDSRSSAVVPLLIGVRYNPLTPAPEDAIRPYLSAALGLYLGLEGSSTVSGIGTTAVSQEAHSETAFGGRVGVGADFLLSNHFKFGVDAGYNLMTNFSNPIGARSNYNGAVGEIGIGYIF